MKKIFEKGIFVRERFLKKEFFFKREEDFLGREWEIFEWKRNFSEKYLREREIFERERKIVTNC